MPHERILVVDDSAEAQQLLKDLVIEPNGYEYLVAQDGAAGLQLAAQEQPDLIILDMQMPKMSGMEVLEALQQQGIATPVIVASVLGPCSPSVFSLSETDLAKSLKMSPIAPPSIPANERTGYRSE